MISCGTTGISSVKGTETGSMWGKRFEVGGSSESRTGSGSVTRRSVCRQQELLASVLTVVRIFQINILWSVKQPVKIMV